MSMVGLTRVWIQAFEELTSRSVPNSLPGALALTAPRPPPHGPHPQAMSSYYERAPYTTDR
jgi:hypothetical protein